jgi:hypothetical protein
MLEHLENPPVLASPRRYSLCGSERKSARRPSRRRRARQSAGKTDRDRLGPRFRRRRRLLLHRLGPTTGPKEPQRLQNRLSGLARVRRDTGREERRIVARTPRVLRCWQSSAQPSLRQPPRKTATDLEFANDKTYLKWSYHFSRSTRCGLQSSLTLRSSRHALS